MHRQRTLTWEDPAQMYKIMRTLSGLDCLQRVIAGELPPPPMAQLMDIRLIEVGFGRAVFASLPSEFHYNPLGVVHGGFAATLLDSAMGCAVHSTLEKGDAYTTIEFKINFLRPLNLMSGEVRGVGTVLSSSRTTALAEGRLDGPDGKLYGFATCTCLIKRAGDRSTA
ncbi:MAG: PaaI family thioesterase [Vicinamibacterales bacterium]